MDHGHPKVYPYWSDIYFLFIHPLVKMMDGKEETVIE